VTNNLDDLDLGAKLEALTSQATALAPVPEVAAVLRRGRRRRQRLTATALLSVLLVGAMAPGAYRLEQRLASTPSPTATHPAAETPPNRFIGWWQDNIDASVYLPKGVNPAGRATVERQLAGLPEVERFWFESPQQGYARFKAEFRDVPAMTHNVTQDNIPAAFRVKLRGPGGLARLLDDLCTPGWSPRT